MVERNDQEAHLLAQFNDLETLNQAHKDNAQDAGESCPPSSMFPLIWRKTPEGELFEHSTGWQDFTGQDIQSANGRGWLSKVHPDDVDSLYTAWSNAAQSERVYEAEYRLLHRDGKYRRVVVHGVPVRLDGRVVEWIGTLTDVEEARRSEERLREGEERLRFALSVSGTAVWDWNIITGELAWNDGHHQIFGRNAETPRVMSDFVAFIHEDDAERITCAIHTALQSDDVTELEYRVVHEDGNVGWVKIMGSVFLRDEHGAAVRKMGVISDITAQKEAEEVLRRSHRALQNEAQSARAEADELRRRLLARLVEAQEEERKRLSRELHDQTGQVLTVVGMNLRSLSEFVDDATTDLRRDNQGLAEELNRRFEALQSAVSSLGEQIGTLARELRPPSLDTLGLPAALRQLISEWKNATNIDAHFDVVGLEGKDPRFASEIEVALYRVVQEGLTNVARHSGAKTVSLLLQKPDHDLRLVIEDDGRGFNPSQTSKNRLGLVGMRERLDAVGGTLQIESEVGAGTTIFARVPLPHNELGGATKLN